MPVEVRKVREADIVADLGHLDIGIGQQHLAGQIDAQLRERRKSFKRRRESLERIRLAADQLDTRLAELSAQDQRLATTEVRLQALDDRVRRAATRHELALPSDFSPLSRPMPLAPAAAPVPAVVTGDA